MRNLLATLRFRGGAYHGYQVQKNALSVAQVFQTALEKILGEQTDIKGCSRTDAGVHANRYGLSFRTVSSIQCDRLVAALNNNLPPDIAVTNCQQVPEDFHARYSCTGKRYQYKIHNSLIKDPFWEGLAYRYRYPIDTVLLGEAAAAFIGAHDFSAFCSVGDKARDKTRTILSFDIARAGDMVTCFVTGDGFLYHMVRIMVGTLLHVASGRIRPDEIPAILAARDRRRAGPTAPAHGLYLDDVFYETIVL